MRLTGKNALGERMPGCWGTRPPPGGATYAHEERTPRPYRYLQPSSPDFAAVLARECARRARRLGPERAGLE